jgi:hypothetical protein
MSPTIIHSVYCRKLREIGEKLGFKTAWDSSGEREGYHRANPDCIWYQSVQPELVGMKGIPGKINFIVFEVLATETEKAMRGSLLSFSLRDAFRGVFVVLRKKDELDKDYQDRIDYLKKIIQKSEPDRFLIWEASDVDGLAKRVGISKDVN